MNYNFLNIKPNNNNNNNAIYRESQDFYVIKVDLDPTNSADYDIIIDALNEGNGMNATTLNPSSIPRTLSQLQKTRYLGALSELLVERIFNIEIAKRTTKKFKIERKPFVDYNSHIDLTIETESKVTKIEIRGSYPFAIINDVIWKHFTLIGSYSTNYKQGEELKDYHIGTLINQKVDFFSFTNPHSLYIVGGAERNLFDTRKSLTSMGQTNAVYKGIKPMADARDILELLDLMAESI